VSYLSTGLAGYLVGPEISCGARKLARTPQVKKKKKGHESTIIVAMACMTIMVEDKRVLMRKLRFREFGVLRCKGSTYELHLR
jgi:hypothetical protein